MSAGNSTAVRVDGEIAVDCANIIGPVCSRGVGDIEIVGEVAIPAGDEFLRLWRSLGDVSKDGGPRLVAVIAPVPLFEPQSGGTVNKGTPGIVTGEALALLEGFERQKEAVVFDSGERCFAVEETDGSRGRKACYCSSRVVLCAFQDVNGGLTAPRKIRWEAVADDRPATGEIYGPEGSAIAAPVRPSEASKDPVAGSHFVGYFTRVGGESQPSVVREAEEGRFVVVPESDVIKDQRWSPILISVVVAECAELTLTGVDFEFPALAPVLYVGKIGLKVVLDGIFVAIGAPQRDIVSVKGDIASAVGGEVVGIEDV